MGWQYGNTLQATEMGSHRIKRGMENCRKKTPMKKEKIGCFIITYRNYNQLIREGDVWTLLQGFLNWYTLRGSHKNCEYRLADRNCPQPSFGKAHSDGIANVSNN